VPQGEVVGGTFQNVPLCTSVPETGCAIAYRTYAEGHPPLGLSNAAGGTLDTACTNPAALGGGEGRFAKTYLPTRTNQPLYNVTPDPGLGTPFVLFADFYAGECVQDATGHSYLEIRVRPEAGDVRTNPVPFDNILFDPSFLGTHVVDYNWAMGDLLDLVAAKATALGVGP
jgi:hypothetical protein